MENKSLNVLKKLFAFDDIQEFIISLISGSLGYLWGKYVLLLDSGLSIIIAYIFSFTVLMYQEVEKLKKRMKRLENNDQTS